MSRSGSPVSPVSFAHRRSPSQDLFCAFNNLANSPPVRLGKEIGRGGQGQVYAGKTPGGIDVALKLANRVGDKEAHRHIGMTLDLGDISSVEAGVLRAIAADVPVEKPAAQSEIASHVDLDLSGISGISEEEPQTALVIPLCPIGLKNCSPSIQKLATENPLLYQQFIAFFADFIGRVLPTLERLGIVHHDIKPDNILLESGVLDGVEGRFPVLADWGSTEKVGEIADEADSFAGISVAYAAPERLFSEGNHLASDVYSMGLVLQELLGQTTWNSQITEGKDATPALFALGEEYKSVKSLRAAAVDPVEHQKKLLSTIQASLNFLHGMSVLANHMGALIAEDRPSIETIKSALLCLKEKFSCETRDADVMAVQRFIERVIQDASGTKAVVVVSATESKSTSIRCVTPTPLCDWTVNFWSAADGRSPTSALQSPPLPSHITGSPVEAHQQGLPRVLTQEEIIALFAKNPIPGTMT